MENKCTKKTRALTWWAVSVLWLALTLFLSNQVGSSSYVLSTKTADSVWTPLVKLFPGLDAEDFHFFIRKSAHFGVHAILAFSVFRASFRTFRRKGVALIFALALSGIIAIFNELVQLRAPGRVWAITDAGLNLLGVCIGTCLSATLP